MPTLYVENVPEELYAAIRKRARSGRKSIAAEVLAVLEEAFPSAEELDRRGKFFRRIQRIRSQTPPSPGPFPSTEEWQRVDRER